MNSHRRHIVGAIGTLLGIALLQLIADGTATPLLIAPFGATFVLLFTVPDAPAVHPRNIVGGYAIAGFLGLAVLNTFGVNPFTLGLSVAMSLYAMQVTKTVHPPAGAIPLLVMFTKPTWEFMLTPLAAGVAIILVFSYGYHKILRKF